MHIESWPIVHGLVYHPRRHPGLSPEVLGLPGDRVRGVTTQTEDGLTLHGWHFLNPGSGVSPDPRDPDRDRCQPRVIYFPGRGGHRGYRVLEVDLLLDAGAEVLLFDYRGYGDNPGRPSQTALGSDARKVWDHAVQVLQWRPDQIVLYGESLGGAVATRLAAKLSRRGSPPAGLILRSTFTSFADAAGELYPLLRWFIPRDWYPSLQHIPHVTCPILSMHGELDTLVPIEMGRRLFESAPDRSQSGIQRRFVSLPQSEHNQTAVTNGPEMRRAIAEFLATAARPSDVASCAP